MLNQPPEPTHRFPFFEFHVQMSYLHVVVPYGVHIWWYCGLLCSCNDSADDEDEEEEEDDVMMMTMLLLLLI